MARLSTAGLIRQQVGYELKMFIRTPIAAFFTLIFPLLLLFIFGALFGNEEIPELGITVAQYFAPALAVFSAASATYTNIGVFTSFQRDEGILKRVRGTPLPPWIFFVGKMLSSFLIAAAAVSAMMLVGVLVYDIQIMASTLPAAIISFFAGVICFAALGLLVAAVAPSGNAATAIANSTLLPLAFFSGLFIPLTDDSPTWLVTLGDIFPLKHFNDAFQAAFLPTTTGAGFDWPAIGYMLLWAAVAMLLALRLFKWESRSGGSEKNRAKAMS